MFNYVLKTAILERIALPCPACSHTQKSHPKVEPWLDPLHQVPGAGWGDLLATTKVWEEEVEEDED